MKQVYTFEFDHFTQAEVLIVADKTSIAADGVEQVTIDVTCEDTTETQIVLVILKGDIKVASIPVAMTAGVGQHIMTTTRPGSYTIKADPDILDGVWGRAKFSSNEVIVEATANATLAVIKTQAQSAVGVDLTALTAAQIKSLVAILLWQAGGVDKDGLVNPLSEWVK